MQTAHILKHPNPKSKLFSFFNLSRLQPNNVRLYFASALCTVRRKKGFNQNSWLFIQIFLHRPTPRLFPNSGGFRRMKPCAPRRMINFCHRWSQKSAVKSMPGETAATLAHRPLPLHCSIGGLKRNISPKIATAPCHLSSITSLSVRPLRP